jgi:hypothetical protein
MRRVWWDATVTTLTEGLRETRLKGELLYARGHGYAPQSTSVTFRDGGILLERGTGAKANPHKWRPAGHESRSSTSEDSEPQIAESPTLPASESNLECKGAQRGLCVCCTSLIHRIETLERTALHPAGFSEDITALLSVLKIKLGAQLDLPLASHGERASANRGAQRTFQELLSVQADCSLSELEHIAGRACQMLPDNSQCIPSFSPGARIRPQTYKFCMAFSTYFALCQFLGIKCSAEVLDSVIKVRTKGKDTVTIATRVIGALFCQESDPSLPLVIAIGHSMHWHEGTSNRVPVLLRRDTTWDEVNKVYEHIYDIYGI